jgi:hypothetical protein
MLSAPFRVELPDALIAISEVSTDKHNPYLLSWTDGINTWSEFYNNLPVAVARMGFLIHCITNDKFLNGQFVFQHDIANLFEGSAE